MRRPWTKGEVVLGLDLSLTGSAAVVLGSGWRPEEPTREVIHHRFGDEGKLEGIERQAAIVNGIWRLAIKEGVTRAFVEEHSFGKGLMKYAFARAELVGAVKLSLWSIDRLATVPVVASGARKLLFGKQQRMGSKEWKAFIRINFTNMQIDLPDEDTRDAYVVANGGRHVLGLPCLAVV